MKIRPVSSLELSSYDDLAHRFGTLFNRLEWIQIFGDKIKILGLFDSGEHLVGGFSLFQERRWGLKIYRRAPFTPTCGPFLKARAQNPAAAIEERRKALYCLINYLEKESPAICMLPLDRSITDALPFYWRGYKTISHYTYLIDLTTPLDQILKNMSSNHRGHIAKAVRDGLTVQRTTDLKGLRDMVLATFDRQQKFVDRQCLDAILYTYANSSNSYAFSTYKQDEAVAICFVVHDAKTAYYLLGAYNKDNRHHGAGVLAIFEAIKHAQQIGLNIFDFEGSIIPAIERYFRDFGGQLTPYFTVNKAWFPFELALKLVKRNLF